MLNFVFATDIEDEFNKNLVNPSSDDEVLKLKEKYDELATNLGKLSRAEDLMNQDVIVLEGILENGLSEGQSIVLHTGDVIEGPILSIAESELLRAEADKLGAIMIDLPKGSPLADRIHDDLHVYSRKLIKVTEIESSIKVIDSEIQNLERVHGSFLSDIERINSGRLALQGITDLEAVQTLIKFSKLEVVKIGTKIKYLNYFIAPLIILKAADAMAQGDYTEAKHTIAGLSPVPFHEEVLRISYLQKIINEEVLEEQRLDLELAILNELKNNPEFEKITPESARAWIIDRIINNNLNTLPSATLNYMSAYEANMYISLECPQDKNPPQPEPRRNEPLYWFCGEN
jgi:hypothetical protein